MANKLAFIDTETTGINPYIHGIIEISYILTDSSLNELSSGTLTLNPLSYNRQIMKIDNKALEVNGTTKQQIETYRKSINVRQDFTTILSDHIDAYDKKDRYTMAGYNVEFDFKFVDNWFADSNTQIGRFFNYQPICVMHLAKFMEINDMIPAIPSYKLANIYQQLTGQTLDAHKALHDIRATLELYKYLLDIIKKDNK